MVPLYLQVALGRIAGPLSHLPALSLDVPGHLKWHYMQISKQSRAPANMKVSYNPQYLILPRYLSCLVLSGNFNTICHPAS